MGRNLQSRVEVLTPVEDPGSARRNWAGILDAPRWTISAAPGTWTPDGGYVQRRAEGVEEGCQQLLVKAAERRHFEATRLRRRKPRGIARRISA